MNTQPNKDQVGSDKEVETALTSIHAKVTGVKGALSNFVGKMEHEQLTWPSVLDSFASVSSHTSLLMKQLCSDKMPPLHTRVILPLEVSSDRDPELEKQTEGRVPVLHHEIIPNYLRTKLDLELEAKQNKLAEKAKEEEPVIKEKIKDFNELLSDSLDRIIEMRDILDDQRTRKDSSQATSAETKKLVALYLHGTGLPVYSGQKRTQVQGKSATGRGAGGRMPSAVRTDMKQAIQTSTAPYNRGK